MPDLESGLGAHRFEYVEETTDAQGDVQYPTDPSWNRVSDTIYSVDPTVEPGLAGDRGLGDIDTDTRRKGPEDASELTVSYPLQQWIVDGSGNANDLSAYGFTRDSDNQVPSSLMVVDREETGTISAVSTVEGQENGAGGATAKASRMYWVARGVKLDPTLTVDPTSDQPAIVEAAMTCAKLRRYQVDQPSSSQTLHVESTDSGDTSQTLTIEDDGASTSEDVSLSGTTAVQTTASFGSIDALELDSETAGRVKVSLDSSGSPGETIAVIEGSADYDDIEGDLGVPALGSGSHASAIGGSYLRTLTDSITYSGSSDFWFRINSKELAVDNNIDTAVRDDSLMVDVREGVRDTELTTSTYGESQSYQDAREALTNSGADIVWSFPGASVGNGDITLSTAKLTDPGLAASEAEEPRMTHDEVFMPEGGGTGALTID